MSGIYLAEIVGAFIRWLLNGFNKTYKYYLKDEKNQSGVPINFMVGLFTLLTILFILVCFLY
jgi:hypothetical protein